MKDKNYKSISVSVQSESPIITQAELDKIGETLVTFVEVSCNPYVSNNFIALSFKVDKIKVLKK